MALFHGAFPGSRVLITGHTGFKGAWLAFWLRQLGAEVHGYALPPVDEPNLYQALGRSGLGSEYLEDIRNRDALTAALRKVQPAFVFHLAAQSLVRPSYSNPLDTLEINGLGTANLLESLRVLGRPVTVVVVTSDKCYENRDWPFGYRETDALGGHDVYSMSKAVAELITQSWRRSFFETDACGINVATVRAGNVIGGGDYTRDRLLPDCVRAWLDLTPLRIRYPQSVRPWQHVWECLGGYLWLAARLAQPGLPANFPRAFNFGPESDGELTVQAIVERVQRRWPGPRTVENPEPGLVEAGRLELCLDQARHWLNWRPLLKLTEALDRTLDWYEARHGAKAVLDLVDFSAEQLDAYQSLAQERGACWAGATEI